MSQLLDKCASCNSTLEQCDESVISLGIVCLGTFIHREPALAAPMLLDMLQTVARYNQPFFESYNLSITYILASKFLKI